VSALHGYSPHCKPESPLSRVGGRIRIGGGYQSCSCAGSSLGFCYSSSTRYWRTVWFTCAASSNCSRGMRLSLLHWPRQAAIDRQVVPCTSPSSRQRHDLRKQLLEPCRFLESSMSIVGRCGVVRNLLIEPQPDKSNLRNVLHCASKTIGLAPTATVLVAG
jgi:hypothetical protein